MGKLEGPSSSQTNPSMSRTSAPLKLLDRRQTVPSAHVSYLSKIIFVLRHYLFYNCKASVHAGEQPLVICTSSLRVLYSY
jgi:hypothetical protein